MRKPKVLFVTESSFLSSGYSTYTNEVLKRLYSLDEFQLYELGSFGDFNDERAQNIPWTFIPVVPDPNNKDEVATYESNMVNKFGAAKFEETLLKYKPDIVHCIRDWWADSFMFSSPLREFYHLSAMPTCDSTPQNMQWIASYIEADSIFAYTDWGLNVLKEESNNRIKAVCSAPPGADINVFKPIPNKKEFLKQLSDSTKLGLPEDVLIIGTVMRNMKRKLYPDIIETFAKYLKEAPEEIRNRTYLYLHTAFPDAGWDIPRLLKDNRVGHRTLFTYVCKACGESYPNYFQDAIAYCKLCKEKACYLPGAGSGVSRDVLARIVNMFDVYLQIANCEGFGMPMVEAASCEVPVFATDYSAMSDVVRKVHGVPIKVKRFVKEAETYRNFAYPDLDDLQEKLISFFMQPESLRKRMGYLARKGVLENYTYEKTSKIWANHFRSIPLKDHSLTWNSPSRVFVPKLPKPDQNGDLLPNLNDEEFVRWCIINILNRPDKINSYTALRLARDLNWRSTTGGMGGIVWNDASALGIEAIEKRGRFDRQNVVDTLLHTANEFLHWENERIKK